MQYIKHEEECVANFQTLRIITIRPKRKAGREGGEEIEPTNTGKQVKIMRRAEVLNQLRGV